jgi:hypothetical protein
MILCNAPILVFPAKAETQFLLWAAAFAGVTGFLI